MIINILTVSSKHYLKMPLTVLVVSKLTFPGYLVCHGRYVYTIEHVSIKGVLLRFSLIMAPSYCHKIPIQ